jgi:hypothetical protein
VSWNRRWVTLTNAELAYAFEKVEAPWRAPSALAFACTGLSRAAALHAAAFPLHIPHCVVRRAERHAHRPAGWQSKKIIDRIHVSEILDVVTENDAATSGDGLECQRPAYLGASLTGANRREPSCMQAGVRPHSRSPADGVCVRLSHTSQRKPEDGGASGEQSRNGSAPAHLPASSGREDAAARSLCVIPCCVPSVICV